MGLFDWIRRKPQKTPEQVDAVVRDIIDRLDAYGYQDLIEWYPALGIAGHDFYNLAVPDDAAARQKLQLHVLGQIRAYLDDTTDREELDEVLAEIERAKLPISTGIYRNRIVYAERSQLARVRGDIANAVRDHDLETLIRGFLELDEVWNDLDLDVKPREVLHDEIGRALAGFLPSPFARDYERMRKLMRDVSGSRLVELKLQTFAELRPRPPREVAPEPVNAELERALAVATTDAEHREASLVLADWLQEREHPRGKLIALELAGEPTSDLILEHAEELLGPLAREKVFGGLSWRRGFVESAIVSSIDPRCCEILEHVLAQRGLAELAIGINADDPELIARMIATIIAARPKLRALHFTDLPDDDHPMPWHETDFRALWPALPALRTLVIHNRTPTLGSLVLPELERAMFKIDVMQEATVAALAGAELPKLRTLDLWFEESGFEDYRTILGGQVPALVHLGLINSAMTDDVVSLLGRFASTLTELDLTDGSLTDDGAETLAAMRLPQLASLEVTRNHVTAAGLARLRGVYPTVIAG